MTKKSKIKRIKEKLTNKYQLVILNEDTLQEYFSLKLSRLNIYVLSGLFSILIIIFTALLIAFTPLKEYIPGYMSSNLKRQISSLVYTSDSLKVKLTTLEKFTQSIKPILTGNIKPELIDSIQRNNNRLDNINLNATKEDSLFREKIENENKFSLSENIQNRVSIVFFAPITGHISEKFDFKTKHFATDIVAKIGTPVKAVADGTVIFSEWTIETGYVIMIQHIDNYISIYKHNNSILKQQGDFVKSGEVISTVGNTGKYSTGSHLHFELWHNGYPVNPEKYIDFQ